MTLYKLKETNIVKVDDVRKRNTINHTKTGQFADARPIDFNVIADLNYM